MKIPSSIAGFVCSVLMSLSAPPALAGDVEKLLAPTRAAYAALTSYSDSGVLIDNASGYRHTFKTYYRAPRHFYFEYNMDPKAGGWRYVLWCDGGDFQSWNSVFKTREVFTHGSGTTVGAFRGLSNATYGAILIVPSLLYAGSGLGSVIDEIVELDNSGTESIQSHRSDKLFGIAQSVYAASQRVHNVRPVTVWIDAQSGLITKLLEETPQGLPPGAILSKTVLYEAQANPTLGDEKFRFVVPK